MVDENVHILSVCESGPACLVSTGNEYYTSSTTGWGCPPMKNKLGEMYNYESNFWANGEQMDSIWDLQDATLAEHALGFSPGAMEGQTYYRFNDINPANHNYRLATGYEPGANEYFTGRDRNGNIDSNIYNGKTSGYVDEAVSDIVPMSEINVEGPREFTSPQKEIETLKSGSEKKIEEEPDVQKRNSYLSAFNERIDLLNGKIDREKEYLNNRADNIQSNIAKGKYSENELEQSRAQEEIKWCREYSNQLQDIKNEAEETRNALNMLYGNPEERNQNDIPKGGEIEAGQNATSNIGKEESSFENSAGIKEEKETESQNNGEAIENLEDQNNVKKSEAVKNQNLSEKDGEFSDSTAGSKGEIKESQNTMEEGVNTDLSTREEGEEADLQNGTGTEDVGDAQNQVVGNEGEIPDTTGDEEAASRKNGETAEESGDQNNTEKDEAVESERPTGESGESADSTDGQEGETGESQNAMEEGQNDSEENGEDVDPNVREEREKADSRNGTGSEEVGDDQNQAVGDEGENPDPIGNEDAKSQNSGEATEQPGDQNDAEESEGVESQNQTQESG